MTYTKLMSPMKVHAVTEGINAKIDTDLPVVFSAGPIRNGPMWHDDAIRYALKREEAIFFATPRRKLDSDLKRFLVECPIGCDRFERQRPWERHYLNLAAEKGCVFFWLCKPLPREQWTDPEKSYAQITMLELGEWIARKAIDPSIRLVIGTDGSFPEWRTILNEIEHELPDLPLYASLASTVNAAIDVAILKGD